MMNLQILHLLFAMSTLLKTAECVLSTRPMAAYRTHETPLWKQ